MLNMASLSMLCIFITAMSAFAAKPPQVSYSKVSVRKSMRGHASL